MRGCSQSTDGGLTGCGGCLGAQERSDGAGVVGLDGKDTCAQATKGISVGTHGHDHLAPVLMDALHVDFCQRAVLVHC